MVRFGEVFSEIPNLTSKNIKSVLRAIFPQKTLHQILPLKAPVITYHVKTAAMINMLLTSSRAEIKVGDVVSVDIGSTDDLPVGSVGVVTEITEEFYTCIKLERGFNFISYTVMVDGEEHILNLINPSELDEYVEYCRRFRENKSKGEQYVINKLVREHLTKLSHAYGITAHRAQGQTYDTSYIAFEDILSCRDKSLVVMILYSAISRAKGNAILVTIPDHFKKPTTELVDLAFWKTKH
jgi:hypothetical protein